MPCPRKTSLEFSLELYRKHNAKIDKATASLLAAQTSLNQVNITFETRMDAICDIAQLLLFNDMLMCRTPKSYTTAAKVDKRFYHHIRITKADFGHQGGGSRGEMGDSDPEPTYWVAQPCVVLHACPEPTQEFKAYLLEQFPTKTGEMIQFFEQLWENSVPYDVRILGNINHPPVNYLFSPSDSKVLDLLGVTQSEMAQLHKNINSC